MRECHTIKPMCKTSCQDASQVSCLPVASSIPFLDQDEPPFPWTQSELNEQEWRRIFPLLPDYSGQRGRPRTPESDFRFINGILWILRTGAPWRDLPPRFGSKSSVWSRLHRWQASGIWEAILEGVQDQEASADRIDWEIHHVDSVTCRAHPCAAGARHDAQTTTEEARANESLGKSRGGWCSKIHIRCDGRGRPMCLCLSEGQRHDTVFFKTVMDMGAVRSASGQEKIRPKRVAADKAYGSTKNRKYLRSIGVKAVIPYLSLIHISEPTRP